MFAKQAVATCHLLLPWTLLLLKICWGITFFIKVCFYRHFCILLTTGMEEAAIRYVLFLSIQALCKNSPLLSNSFHTSQFGSILCFDTAFWYYFDGFCQRLEFLGDAVLDYLITSYLFSVYPKLKPGHLTDLRSVSVNNRAFANVAVNQSFHEFLIRDSSGLSKDINSYVDFVKTPASERGLLEEPKCPKVNIEISLYFSIFP